MNSTNFLTLWRIFLEASAMTVLLALSFNMLAVVQYFMSCRQLISDQHCWGSWLEEEQLNGKGDKRTKTFQAVCSTNVQQSYLSNWSVKKSKHIPRHIHNFFFFKARLDMIERQACCISPSSPTSKRHQSGLQIHRSTATHTRTEPGNKACEKADVIGL